MTFMIQGLDIHERMSVEQLFKRPPAEKVQALVPERPVSEKDHPVDEKDPKHRPRAYSAASAYQVIEQLPKSSAVLFAEQIMTSPVLTLSPRAKISNAVEIFQTKLFRHLPVVTDGNRLAGILSDRDIMRHLGGLTEDYRRQVPHTADDNVEQLMQPRVLAASPETDVRYIARLFVEQHVGAMPIVTDGKLTGIVTRSDILDAVMRHFVLELWA